VRPRRDDVTVWLARLADGERVAFDPLFDAAWPLVRAFCRRALGGAAEADDAAQEALARVFGRAAEFDRERDGLSWILGIAAWQCRTELRRRARRGETALAAAPEPVAAEGSRPDELAMRRELLAAAEVAMGELSAADHATIAAALADDADARGGIAPATFRKRLERALERLRQAWRSRHGHS
jgi:RNA polymerase sigma-70 factor, ECF subfamily